MTLLLEEGLIVLRIVQEWLENIQGLQNVLAMNYQMSVRNSSIVFTTGNP